MLKSYFSRICKIKISKSKNFKSENLKNRFFSVEKNLKRILFFSLMIFILSPISFAQNNSNNEAIQNAQMNFIENLQSILEDSNGDLSQAIAAFDTMPELIKDDTELLLIKCSLLISAGRVNESLSIISKLEEKNPDKIEILELKIIAAKAKGNDSKSVQEKKLAITKVLELDPENAIANIALGQDNVLQKKYKNARNYFKKALLSSPTDPDALFGVGQTTYYLGEFDNAQKYFKKLIELNPQEAIAYQYLGKLSAEKENYKDARDYCKKAISLEPGNFDYYMDLGTYERFLGKFTEAENAWSKAIELNPTYFLAYAYRAGLYDEQNKTDKALEDYRKVIETNPSYYFAYESIGILAYHQNHFEEAKNAFEKAFSYNKQNFSYPLMMSACLLKLKKNQEAKNVLQNAMKIKEDKKDLEFSMLRLFHDLGPSNAENDIALRIQKEDNSTTRGKMLYYFGLFYEIKNIPTLTKKYYGEVKNMQSPLFFEYRLAEWGLENE